jgi:hypothetical protein
VLADAALRSAVDPYGVVAVLVAVFKHDAQPWLDHRRDAGDGVDGL